MRTPLVAFIASLTLLFVSVSSEQTCACSASGTSILSNISMLTSKPTSAGLVTLFPQAAKSISAKVVTRKLSNRGTMAVAATLEPMAQGAADNIWEPADFAQQRGEVKTEIQKPVVRDVTVSSQEQDLKDAEILSRHWPSSWSKAEASERQIMRHMKTPYRKLEVEIKPAKPGGFFSRGEPAVTMNTLVVGNGPKKVVLYHGYGAGAGFWYPTLAGLARRSNEYTIYAVDMLGFGLSSRAQFPSHRDEKKLAEAAEDFFVDAMERWRVSMGLDRFVLVGHSLGGFMSGVYSLRHPERVQKLVLVSPAALPGRPAEDKFMEQAGLGIRIALGLINWNFTPFSIVRAAGPKGPSLIHRYVDGRFGHLPIEVRDDLHRYMYHTSTQKGSGEYALKAVFRAGSRSVYGANPLGPRLRGLAMPTVFFYGDNDWMNVNDAYRARNEMRVHSRVHVVPNAGHNLFLDNPRWFNSMLMQELDSTE